MATKNTKRPRLQDNPNFHYTFHETIGMCCEDGTPTPEMRSYAFGVARDYCARNTGNGKNLDANFANLREASL